MYTLQEEAVIEQELTKCDRCKKGYEEKELKAHWEDGVEFRAVCLFESQEEGVQRCSVTNVKMNDKMKELLSLYVTIKDYSDVSLRGVVCGRYLG